MKTVKEIDKFLSDKLFNLSDNYMISQFALAKGINVCTQFDNNINQEAINCTFKDFLEWFECETKEDNQDTIIFEGKEYEFVETNSVSCIGCDLSNKVKCNTIPCATSNRKDKRGGIFKLKTIQEQKLELIPNEFYTVKIDDVIIDTLIFEGTTQDMLCFGYSISFQGRNKNTLWTGYDENIKYARSYQLATPEEKQQLIDAVEKQENKLWNEQTKTFEDKPKDILVPENIKIIKYQNNQLGLVFNENKQVLTFSEGVYMVMPFDKLDKFISCRLEKTTFEKLEIGNIFCIDDNIEHEHNYRVKISDSKCTWVGVDLFTTSIKDYSQIVYKLIPIK